jgi:spore germination protein KB
MQSGKINMLQACSILALVLGLLSHVVLNPLLLDAAGRDAWIAVLATGVLFLIWSAILVYIMKKSGQQKLYSWLAERTNPFIAWLVIIPLGVQLYVMGGMSVIHTTSWTITNYLPETPILVLALAFLLCTYYAAFSGLRTIAIISGILLPVVIILGIFVAGANVPHKDYSLLKPIMEYGTQPVLKGMLYAGGGFAELAFLLVMQHRIRTQVKWWHAAAFALFLILITLGPIVGAITEFGPVEAAKQMESPYIQWRLVKIGHYIEHVDFLSVYQWLSGAFIRVSLAMYLLSELFPFKSQKARHICITAVCLTYFLYTLLPMSRHILFEWLHKYYFLSSLIMVLSLSILLAGIASISKSTKKGTA